MQSRIASSTLLCLVLVAVPASAQVLYDNGRINGTTDAWTINFGYVVSDTVSTFKSNSSKGGGGPNYLVIGVWEFPGDVMTSVDWSFTSSSNGGTVYGSGTASGSNLADQFISSNQYGYDIDKITVSGLHVTIPVGTTAYWLNLQSAQTPSGDPVFWDENSGIGCGGDDGKGGGCPSEAESAVGTIPSEAFTIYGTSGGTIPEPSSIMLFASGILAVAGVLRRKLM